MSNRIRKARYDNIKRLNESLNSDDSLNEACINAGNKCTAAISCGGENAYHGTVTFACTCSTSMGDFGSGWIDCGSSGDMPGGGMTDIDIEKEGGKTRTKDIKDMTPKQKQLNCEPCMGGIGCSDTSPPCYCSGCTPLVATPWIRDDLLEELNEDCGCNGKSGDNIHGDWVDDNLSQINKMVDSANAGGLGGHNIGAGGCPSGQHWCAGTNECHDDAKPQMEPLTLMGADVISLNEQANGSLASAIANAKEQGFDFFSGEEIGGKTSSKIPIKEQTSGAGCKRIYVKICDGVQSNTNFSSVPLGACVFIDGNTPQVGDQWVAPATLGNQQAGGLPMYTGYAGMNVEVTQVLPPPWWAGAFPWMITSVPCPGSPSACDTSTASPCAVQWFQNPNATWASNWITNRDCSNYNWPGINLPVQALQLMSSAPNPQPGPYNSWNDIWTKANAAWPNTTGAPKNTFIGKMAKGRYAECQMAACNC